MLEATAVTRLVHANFGIGCLNRRGTKRAFYIGKRHAGVAFGPEARHSICHCSGRYIFLSSTGSVDVGKSKKVWIAIEHMPGSDLLQCLSEI